MPQSSELIEHAAQAPDVALVVVFFALHNFWRHIIRRTNARLRQLTGRHHATDPKITNLDHRAVVRQEDVLRFKVAVEHVLAVDMLHR